MQKQHFLLVLFGTNLLAPKHKKAQYLMSIYHFLNADKVQIYDTIYLEIHQINSLRSDNPEQK